MIKRRLFDIVGMRSVIGGNRIDGAVGQACLYRRNIFSGSQRWIDFEDRIVGSDFGMSEGEVMRCRFGRDIEAAGFRVAHERNSPCG